MLCHRLTSRRLTYVIISIKLVLHGTLLKPGLCEINDVQSNPNSDSNDVTEKRGGSYVYPEITNLVQNNTQVQNAYSVNKLNATSVNITDMELCYLLFGEYQGKLIDFFNLTPVINHENTCYDDY